MRQLFRTTVHRALARCTAVYWSHAYLEWTWLIVMGSDQGAWVVSCQPCQHEHKPASDPKMNLLCDWLHKVFRLHPLYLFLLSQLSPCSVLGGNGVRYCVIYFHQNCSNLRATGPPYEILYQRVRFGGIVHGPYGKTSKDWCDILLCTTLASQVFILKQNRKPGI